MLPILLLYLQDEKVWQTFYGLIHHIKNIRSQADIISHFFIVPWLISMWNDDGEKSDTKKYRRTLIPRSGVLLHSGGDNKSLKKAKEPGILQKWYEICAQKTRIYL